MRKIKTEEHILGADIIISYKRRIKLSDITGLSTKGNTINIELNDMEEIEAVGYSNYDNMEKDFDLLKTNYNNKR